MDKYKEIIQQFDELFRTKAIKDKDTWIAVLKKYYLVLENMFENGEESDKQESVKIGIKKLLPLLESTMVNANKLSDDELEQVYVLYRKTQAFVSRRSLEHFIVYMESDRREDRKVYENRREILEPFCYYLNKSLFSDDEKHKYIIASYPPSFAKTFMLNYFSAFVYGVDFDSSILRLSYSEELVLAVSRQVKEIISDKKFSEVFPNFAKMNNRIFSKSKDSDWQLNGADNSGSHIARTRDGSVTGVRANRYIMLDDMIKGSEESTNVELHKQYYDKWASIWQNRYDGNRTKYIIVGTMWSPDDIINRIISDIEKDHTFYGHEKYRFLKATRDEYAVVIRTPLLDSENKSTCENIITTERALKLKRDTDEYLWSAVYQQTPIAPTGLEFAYDNLRVYDTLDSEKINNYAKAVLDPSRKGKDHLSMPIFKQKKDEEETYYFVDCIFKREAITELYDLIVDKIVEHNILELVIENNTDTSLKMLLDKMLEERNITFCEIKEKYNTTNKEKRIKDARGIAKRQIVYPSKTTISVNTDKGRFMNNFTNYSFDYANRFDDAPDSIAMFVSECILAAPKNEVTKIDWIRKYI